jgi:hypothetical protein
VRKIKRSILFTKYDRSRKNGAAQALRLENTGASNDPSVKARVEQAVNELKARVTPNNATPALAKQLARGNEVLGNTKQALKWKTAANEKSLESAKAQVKPNLKVDPNLKARVTPSP